MFSRCSLPSSGLSIVIKGSALSSTTRTAAAPAFCAFHALVVKKQSPRSMRTKLGRPPACLGLKEMSNWSKLWHAFLLVLGYSTQPCRVPPYCGTPKLPMAHSYLPLSSSGDVTWMLFFSTTNRPAASSDMASAATTSSANHAGSFILRPPIRHTANPTLI
uniref:Uncharacterized protein n=1 Tax=Arundo donax TaxID=35708 RepID=A0A0A9GDM4_ARUDO